MQHTPRDSTLIERAIDRRSHLFAHSNLGAFRLVNGAADGLPGVDIDWYGSGAVMNVYDGVAPHHFDARAAAHALLNRLTDSGLRAVYLKNFVRDRSSNASNGAVAHSDPTPLAGAPIEPCLLIREYARKFEVHLYDGFSTGLFLDQRENRESLAQLSAGMSVLNTYSYTCAFSVACAHSGATTTSVDVSPRYLEWGKRNFAHNNLDPGDHRFFRMDAFEFLRYAGRKDLTYDLIILDPPTFAAGNRARGIKPWNARRDYHRLISAAVSRLAPRGRVFASTNCLELCRPGRLDDEIHRALGHRPRALPLPPLPEDIASDPPRLAYRLFRPDERAARGR